MKSRFFFFIILLTSQWITSQILSPNSEISVLTIGPGTSLNDAFGHSIFRINDPVNRLDITYDYGRFPFNEPGFYLNFARGKLNYSIGQGSYREIKDFYVWQNRTIKEQVLNLSLNEKQAIFNYLKNNYKPENRNYLYDFFYDNCATKIKDVLKANVSGTIAFKNPNNFEPKSFRTLIQQNLNYNSWGSLGIDVALGSVIDQTATPEEYMFLPEYIHSFFGNASLNATQNKLVKSETIIYENNGKVSTNGISFLFSPLVIICLIAFCIIFVTYKDFKNQKRSHYLDNLLFSTTGVIGILLLLLWFATDHTATAQNYNLLWAFPLNVFIGWKLKHMKMWLIKYLKFLVIILCLMTFHWIVKIQVFAPVLIPLIIALGIRYVFLIYWLKPAE